MSKVSEELTVPDMKIFAGNATPELAKQIANRLYITLGEAKIGSFSDGEISVEITENVRGADVFSYLNTNLTITKTSNFRFAKSNVKAVSYLFGQFRGGVTRKYLHVRHRVFLRNFWH